MPHLFDSSRPLPNVCHAMYSSWVRSEREQASERARERARQRERERERERAGETEIERARSAREKLTRIEGLLHDSQGQNLALNVLHVLDSQHLALTALHVPNSFEGIPFDAHRDKSREWNVSSKTGTSVNLSDSGEPNFPLTADEPAAKRSKMESASDEYQP